MQDKNSSVQVDTQEQRPDHSDLIREEGLRRRLERQLPVERNQVSADINYVFSLCSTMSYWNRLPRQQSIWEYLASRYSDPATYWGQRGEKRQTACKPGSVAGHAGPRDGHSSGTPVTGRLARPTRAAGPETNLETVLRPPPVPPLLGLAPGGVCRAAPVAGCAVRSYRTLSPLLAGLAARGERSALCGTFPGVAPAGCYPAPCFRGARTFLRRAPEAATAAIRPSGPS